ncbi:MULTISPECIES: MFS transporter small subunit [Arthrobacter]
MNKTSNARVVLSWLLVGVPLAYGVFQTLTRAAALFGG